MFILYAEKNRLILRQGEPVTSGSVNVYPVRFQFSEDWEGLERTAIFQAGYVSRSVLLDGDGETDVPWEVLDQPGFHLLAGVRGRAGEETVLPTVWADLGPILEGAAGGGPSLPPTPDLWRQELDRKGDALACDGQVLSLMRGDRVLSTVQMAGVRFGHGLSVRDGSVSVETAGDFSGDNTLPATAALVQSAVGNIEVLLESI